MSRRARIVCGAALVVCSAVGAAAAEPYAYVVPVATAKVKDRVFTTTLALRNDGNADANCEAIYAVPNDPEGGTLRSRYTVPRGGRPRVEEDVLMEAGAVGTMRIVCSAPLKVAARLQASSDGGQTFDEGRTFAAFGETTAFREVRTISARGDVLVAEIAGVVTTFEAIVKSENGAVLGRKTYEVPAFAQQIVNLAKLREQSRALTVELHVRSGGGALVAGEETRDPALLAMAVRVQPDARRAFEHTAQQVAAARAAETARRNITQQLLLSPFQAAPFQDPATGLVLMRDRWYAPNTGTFLTPDPEAYRDSSNLYIFGKGDPVNHSDPTGRYIDETKILASPLRSRYLEWREDFRAAPLGQQAWDRIMAIPASRFTLTMAPLTGGTDQTGAIASRIYDANGAYVGGQIQFGPNFGVSAPAGTSRNRQEYPRAFDVESTVIFSRRRYRVYAFGHEFGHILSGFDPAQATTARQFTNVSVQQAALSTQIQPLVQKRQRTGALTPAEQQLLRSCWRSNSNSTRSLTRLNLAVSNTETRLDTSSSGRGISVIIGFLSIRIRTPHRHSLPARCRRLSAAIVALIPLACASVPPSHPRCSPSAPRMSNVLFTTPEAFWFTDAVVSLGYHGWGIAPEEVLRDTASGFVAMPLRLRLAPDCRGGPDLRRAAPRASFKRVSGRGRYLEGEKVFELDCICTVEAAPYTEARGGFWQFQ